jgi:hypothetical protein
MANPIQPRMIQTTLNLFLVERKRIVVAEKKFFISPKLSLCNDKIITYNDVWYNRH